VLVNEDLAAAGLELEMLMGLAGLGGNR
jgi:hypothetical protein